MGLSQRKLTTTLQRPHEAAAVEELSKGEIQAVEAIDQSPPSEQEHEIRRELRERLRRMPITRK